jgi:hypothetical protein
VEELRRKAMCHGRTNRISRFIIIRQVLPWHRYRWIPIINLSSFTFLCYHLFAFATANYSGAWFEERKVAKMCDSNIDSLCSWESIHTQSSPNTIKIVFALPLPSPLFIKTRSIYPTHNLGQPFLSRLSTPSKTNVKLQRSETQTDK